MQTQDLLVKRLISYLAHKYIQTFGVFDFIRRKCAGLYFPLIGFVFEYYSVTRDRNGPVNKIEGVFYE